MKVKRMPTMSWIEAPDIITPEDLSKILGCGIETSRNKFNEKGFPIIEGLGNLRKADKEAVRLYLQGNIYTEYQSRTVANRMRKEILENLKEIKEILKVSNIDNVISKDRLGNKCFNIKCCISDEND